MSTKQKTGRLISADDHYETDTLISEMCGEHLLDGGHRNDKMKFSWNITYGI